MVPFGSGLLLLFILFLRLPRTEPANTRRNDDDRTCENGYHKCETAQRKHYRSARFLSASASPLDLAAVAPAFSVEAAAVVADEAAAVATPKRCCRSAIFSLSESLNSVPKRSALRDKDRCYAAEGSATLAWYDRKTN